MTAKIPRSVLDTKSLSRAKALSAWEENIGVMYDIRLVDKASDDFFAKVDAYQFETLMLGECQTVAQSYERSRFRISRDLIDCYAIQLQEKGAWTRRDNGDEASGGDILVLDKAQPQSIAMTDSTTLHLFVPRAVLAPLLSEPDAHNMQVLRASTPLASLLRGHVHNLWRNAAHLDIDEAAGVVQPTVQLIAAAMNGRVAPETLNGIDTALGGAVRRYVNAPHSTQTSRSTLSRKPSASPNARPTTCSRPMMASKPTCAGSGSVWCMRPCAAPHTPARPSQTSPRRMVLRSARISTTPSAKPTA